MDVDRVFDALASPARRQMLRHLAPGEMTTTELAARFAMSTPAVSRHLRLLKQAGLVIDEPQGTRRIYQLQARGVEAVQAYLLEVWGDAAGRFKLLADNTRSRRSSK